jgi:hypothetical protein
MNRRGGGDGVNVGSGCAWRRSRGSGEELGRGGRRQVGRSACGFAPAFGRAEPTHEPSAAHEWGTRRKPSVRLCSIIARDLQKDALPFP